MVLDIFLNFNLSHLNEKISTKTKTIILVLSIYLVLSAIFIFSRYMDTNNFINESRSFYMEQVRSVYNETLKRVAFFYTNRGYANLNSFGIKEALVKKDIKNIHILSNDRWKVLKGENKYLKSMAFYDKDGFLLTSFGDIPKIKLSIKIASSLKKQHGFCTKNEFTYRIIVAAKDAGYIVFTLDVTYFLSEIYRLIDFEGYILVKKPNLNTRLINIKKDETSPFSIFLKNDKNNSETFFENGKSLYAVHRIKGEDINGNNYFDSVFFQNLNVGQKRLNVAIIESILMVFILGIITFIILHYGFNVLIKRIEEYNHKLLNSEEKLKQLNLGLQKRVEEEIEQRLNKERESQEKERMLIHQSKLASMGEMIGNIAHQWRQPLAQVGVILIGIELFYERGKLTSDRLKSKIKEAETQIDYMSKTIDDFRHFFTSEKQKETFSIKEKIETSITLISASLKNNNISCELFVEEDTLVNAYSNEIAQVVLNILNNAKDVLLERKIKNPSIVVRVSKEKDKTCINICDNAGGVKIEPIEKIFEPYISTKHASIGTGIGLYMSKTIIEKNNHGSLTVTNTDKGACFIILL